jgi:hypothetical protein
MEVIHDEVLLIGSSEMNVNVGQSGALVAVSDDGLLLGSTYTDASGNANILFSNSVETPGLLTIIVTAYNKIPYESSVNVIAPEGAYILLNNIALTNSEQEDQLSFGETASVYATIQNVGQDTSSSLNVILGHENGMVNIVNSEILNEGIPPESEVVIGPYEVEVNWNLENGTIIDLILSIQDESQTWEYETEILVSAPVFQTQMINIVDNGNGVFDPGETVILELYLENIGGAPLQNPTFNISTSDPFLTVGDLVFENTLIWDNIESDNNIVNLSIQISASPDAPLGHTSVTGIIIGSGDSNYEHVYPLPITLGLMIEDFETANFMTYSWMHSGDSDWVIHTDSYSGNYSAKSGDVGHSQSSELSINMNIIVGGELSFWSKISAEQGNSSNDYLEFFIDDQPQNLLISGESDWTEYRIDLPIGEHSLSWKYSKDGATTSGEDCAWIDKIQFPPGSVPPLNISFGDVNNDDVVNVLDVIVTVNYLIGYLQFDQQQIQNADMNLDGVVSINDILMIVESALQ